MNSYVYNSLISACAKNGEPKRALLILDDMLKHSVSLDKVGYRLLSSLCMQTGDVVGARKLADIISKSPQCDANKIDCTQLIKTFAAAGKVRDAMDILDMMDHHNIQPDDITYTSLLAACVDSSHLQFGSKVHNHLQKNGGNIPAVVQNALLHMYANCGCLEKAEAIFKEMYSKGIPDIITWNTMLSGYIKNKPENIKPFFDKMLQVGVQFSGVTCTLLFKAAATLSDLALGLKAEDIVMKRNIKMISSMQNTRLHMYLTIVFGYTLGMPSVACWRKLSQFSMKLRSKLLQLGLQ